MKNKLTKKNYAIIFMNMFLFGFANAQIVYTDLIPDTNLNCHSSPADTCIKLFNIDLNNDGSLDFMFSRDYQFLGGCIPPEYRFQRLTTITSLDTNFYYGIYSFNPSALNFGDIINDNLIWSGNSDTLHYYRKNSCTVSPTQFGNWSLTGDFYLPFKIFILNNYHFGWIRMGNYAGIVRDYAYNSIPNQFIFAGDTGIASTGFINNVIQSGHLSVYPNPAINSVSIKFPSDKAGEMQIVNLFGQIVYCEKGISVDINIDVNRFPAGLYVVRWNSGENKEIKIFSVIK